MYNSQSPTKDVQTIEGSVTHTRQHQQKEKIQQGPWLSSEEVKTVFILLLELQGEWCF